MAEPNEPASQAPVAVPDAEPDRPRRSSAGRKGRGRIWIILAVVLAVAVVAAGAWYGYQLSTERTAARDKLAEATKLLEDADVVVLEIDEVVRAEVNAEVGEKAAKAMPKVDPARADLEAAIAMLEASTADLSPADVERADALVASASARVSMLEQATPILEANKAAGSAIDPAKEGWQLALDGEKLADQAVAEYNKLTKTAVSTSATLTAQAEAKLKEGRAKLDEAHKAFPAAGLDVYVVYLDQKLAAVALSKQADAAYLAGENAKANEYSNQYNVKDKQIIESAKKLPASPSAAIAAAYDKQAGEATKAYFQAREQATEADDALRALSE